ncbi:amidohydrolase [Lysinibacter sp. HNR]|uniref:amidohydrolase n=1 Tax=Lysinibacter sp. HNR TaxID=3031408 RepID=UPI002435ABD7|nr:amidohydrolase [Lysinibacter sp. HNR]WGD36969.1 amidohydrolase [Lysinibacter sp. HNR]
MTSIVDVIALRRELHAHPEIAFLEIGTSVLVREHLATHGWAVRSGPEVIDLESVAGAPDAAALDRAAAEAIAAGRNPELVARVRAEGTALIAILEGKRPGPHTAFRFDMDALPLEEATGDSHPPACEGFRSRYPGRMHACAHDGNVAVGLALAARLADRDFTGTVTLVFQPAEEGVRGAAAMLAAAPLTGVERFFGLHLGNSMPSGQVAGSAVGLLATAKLMARFTGRDAHAGSAPEQGRNALLAGATAALNLHALPRFAGDLTRVNVGTLAAGSALNVVPSSAELGVELRAGRGETLDELLRRVRVILAAAAEMQECDLVIEQAGMATSITPDESAIDEVEAAARALGVEDFVRTRVLNASDDFSLFARDVQSRGGTAAFVLVGGANSAPHHHPEFDIDERSLPLAVELLERLVRVG